MKKSKESTIIDRTWVPFKMPAVIPTDIKDPVHYIRGYNGANRCPKTILEIEELWLKTCR